MITTSCFRSGSPGWISPHYVNRSPDRAPRQEALGKMEIDGVGENHGSACNGGSWDAFGISKCPGSSLKCCSPPTPLVLSAFHPKIVLVNSHGVLVIDLQALFHSPQSPTLSSWRSCATRVSAPKRWAKAPSCGRFPWEAEGKVAVARGSLKVGWKQLVRINEGIKPVSS